jgi:NADH-quinone oxidoreductase subunit N
MDMQELMSYPWSIMMPEFIILGVATLLSLLDLFMKEKINRKVLAWLALGGIGAALLFVINSLQHIGKEQPIQQILHDTYRLDGFAIAFKLIFLVGVALVFFLSLDYVNRKDIAYEGEFYYLLLTGLLGAMILASSADMITMFVGLELLSISTYILVGIRKKNLQSNESAFKYVVSGGIATAIMLYGMSFIYGLAGSTNLFEIQNNLAFAYSEGYQFMIYFAFFLTFVGMAFKISVVPFHMWAPDVYQGAPTPITAFLSVVSKAAGFALLLRLLLVAFLPIGSINEETGYPDLIFFELSFYLALAAAASMIIGNTLALRQTNVKRMFAYSSIAQAGYILVPLASLSHAYFVVNNQIVGTTIYYLMAYLFMNIGAFAIIQSVTKQVGSEEVSSFAGLYHRSPFKAVGMSIFLLSLAGLPITAGFFGKFMIFMVSIEQGKMWLAIVMVLTSVVSYFYYFGIIRQMYMRPGESEEQLRLPLGIGIVITVCILGTILLAVFPTYILELLETKFFTIQLFTK